MALTVAYIQGDTGSVASETYDPAGDSYSSITDAPWNCGWGSYGTDSIDKILHKRYQSNASQIYDISADSWAAAGGYTGGITSWAAACSNTGSTLVGGIVASDNAESGIVGQQDTHYYCFDTDSWVELAATGGTSKFGATGFGINAYHHSAGGIPTVEATNEHRKFWVSANVWSADTALAIDRGRAPGGCFQGVYGIIHKGELDGYTSTDTALIFDIAGTSWTTGSAEGTAQTYGGSAFLNNTTYHFGGSAGGGTAASNEYDPLTDAWSSITAMSTARTQATVLPGDSTFIRAAAASFTLDTSPPSGIVGIIIDGSSYVDGDKLDVNITLGTYQRRQSAIDKGLIAGGDDTSSEKVTVQVYSINSNSWAAKTSLTFSRAYQASFPSDPYGNSSWHVGGTVNGTSDDDSEEFSIAGNAWVAVTDVTPANLIRHAAARLSEAGYTFGGQVSLSRVSTIYKLTLSTSAWSTASGTLTAARDNLTAASSDEDTDNAFIIGGNEAGTPVAKCEEYDASADSVTARTAATNTAEEVGSVSSGGSDSILYFKDSFMEIYDISGNSWASGTSPSLDAGSRGLQITYNPFLIGGESVALNKQYNWGDATYTSKSSFSTPRGHFGWNCNAPYS